MKPLWTRLQVEWEKDMKARQEKSRGAEWAKLHAEIEIRKADIMKAYEKKRMAEQKAEQERREVERKAYEKMMAEWKAKQERREAERKARQENLHKLMKETVDANKEKADSRQKEIKNDIKEDTNAHKKADRENLSTRLEPKIDTKMKTDNNQERIDVNLKEMREKIKSGQAEIKSTVNAPPPREDR
jgi:translation initiation factor 4G